MNQNSKSDPCAKVERLFYAAIFLVAINLLFGCASSSQQVSIPQDQSTKTPPPVVSNVSPLASIKSIYLGDFGSEQGADLVREKLRIRLTNSGRFEVVELPDYADAILTGSAGVDESLYEGTSRYRGTGVLRLINTKTQKTVWAHEYQRGFAIGGSATTRVANQMADQLLKDAGAGR